MYNKFNYPVLSFFGLILVLPFIGIFSKLNFDIDSLVNFLSNKYIHRVIFFSLYQAFISALISCIIAIPFSLALNRHKNNKIIKEWTGFNELAILIQLLGDKKSSFNFDKINNRG